MELRREFEAETLRRKDAAQRDHALAWHVALFSRQERLPPFHSVMQIGGASIEDKRREQRQLLEAFALRHNLKIQERVN